MRILLLLALCGWLSAGCARSDADQAEMPAEPPKALLAFTAIDPPAAPGGRLPHLAPSAEGLLLSWTEPLGDSLVALKFSRYVDKAWTPPQTIATGADWFVNWADFPSLIQLDDGSLAAHYLAKSGAATYAYDVRITRSADGGATWSDAVTPHRDGTPTEHGFVSLLPEDDGWLRAVWLDGRNTGGHGHGPGSAMTLRTATLAADGSLSQEAELDSRVCDCCQTGAVRTSKGLVVAYRDRSATTPEVRDISVVRFEDGTWTKPQRLHADDWELNGCPVNGPAVAAAGDRVAVAWFTGAQERPSVRLAFSSDGGATFGPAISIDDGAPIGRVDVALLPAGDALVSWVERTEGAEIRLRRVEAGGTRHAAQTVAPTSPSRASGFPRMVLHDDTVFMAWTEAADPSRLHATAAPLGE